MERVFAPKRESGQAAGFGAGQARVRLRLSSRNKLAVWLFVCAGVLLVGVGAGLVLRPLVPGSQLEQLVPEQLNTLRLRVTDTDHVLRITWNHRNPDLYRASGAGIHISDGAISTAIRLDRSDLEAGAVEYERQSNAGKVLMSLNMPDSTTVSQVISWGQP